MPIFCLFHAALGCMQFHRCFWIYLVQNSVLPTNLQWQTAQAWGRTITLGLKLFFQHRLAVPDPQLVCSLQGLFSGVIEYLWKIRVLVNSRSFSCLHTLTDCGRATPVCENLLSCVQRLSFIEVVWKGNGHQRSQPVPCIASVLDLSWLLILNLMGISSQILNRYYFVWKY